MKQEDYTTRPTAKPSERIPGRLVRWEGTDYVEFQPAGKRDTASRTMLKETKQLSFYRNEGQKEPTSYSLHVNVGGDTDDPAADILEKVQRELAPMAKKEVKVKTPPRYLHDADGLQVWYRKKSQQLCCFIEIDASARSQMSATLIRLMAEINKTINSNKF